MPVTMPNAILEKLIRISIDNTMKSHSESDTCRNFTFFLLKWECEIVRNRKRVTYSLCIVWYMISLENKYHFLSKDRHFRFKGHHFRSKVITSNCFTQMWFHVKRTLYNGKGRHFRFSIPYAFRNRKCYNKKVQSMKCSPWVMPFTGIRCMSIRRKVFEILQL